MASVVEATRAPAFAGVICLLDTAFQPPLLARRKPFWTFADVSDATLWLKALHIASFAAWMAAMWYLPRLFVYHADAQVGSEPSETFKTMERRLLGAIGTPAMVATFAFGLPLAWITGAFAQGWLHAKLALLVVLAGVHGILAKHARLFAQDERPRSATYYRALNEAPTVLFLLIVFLAVMRPF